MEAVVKEKPLDNFLDATTYVALTPFFIDYLKNHSYLTSRVIARTFLEKIWFMTRWDEIYKEYSTRIANRIGKLVSICLKISILTKYNKHGYKIIDIRDETIEKLKEIVRENNKKRPEENREVINF